MKLLLRQRENKVAKNVESTFNLIEELRAGLKVRRDDLDTALLRLPVLHDKVSDLYHRAKQDREGYDADIKNLTAELDELYRSKEPGMKETELRRKIARNKRMQGLQRAFLGAKSRAERLDLLKASYELQSKAIHDLTSLHNANYFVVSSGSKKRDEHSEDEADRIRKEAGKMRRERRNKG